MRLNQLLLLFLTLHSVVVYCQKTAKPNSLYLELGGLAEHYSFNYSRDFPMSNQTGINAGIGFSSSLLSKTGFSPRIPVQSKIYYTIKHHSLDAGLALTPYLQKETSPVTNKSTNQWNLALLGQIGYKYSFSFISCPLFIGLAFTPVFF